MAPVVNSLVTLLAAASAAVGVVDAKPLLNPGRHAPPGVANLISSARRQVHRAMAQYYGWEHGLSKPAPLPSKRGISIPDGWTYFGCVSESWDQRLLQGFAFSSESLTPTLCLTQCQKLGYKFGAAEYSDECYCGNEFIGSGGGLASDTVCNSPCSGNPDETCGASWYLSLYQFNATWACNPPSGVPTSPSKAPVAALPANATAINTPAGPGATNGATVPSTNNSTPLTPGNNGNSNANPNTGTSPVSPGNNTVLIPTGVPGGAVPGVNSTALPNTRTATTATTTTPALGATNLPSTSDPKPNPAPGAGTGTGSVANTTQWYALGCAIDNPERILDDYHRQAIMDLTIDECLSTCEELGFGFAGVEFGEQCFCGKKISSSTVQYDESKCNMKCRGNASETCGGDWALDLYELISGPVSADCDDSKPSTSINATTPTTTTTGTKTGTDSVVMPTTVITTGTVRPTNSGATTGPATTSTTAATTVATTTTLLATTATSLSSPTATAIAPSNPNIPSSGSDHAVWAHHMVGNTYPYGQSDWATDIRLAQAAGIDGFALNMGQEGWQADRVRDAYAAASGTGFKLFLSLDMTSLGCGSWNDAQNLVNLVRSHANDEAQAKHHGKPIVSTFAGSDCHFGQGSSSSWQTTFVDVLQNQYNIDIFFVPSIFSDISTFGSNSWMDGELNWNSAWPMGNEAISTRTDNDYMNALGGKEYMSAVSPFFYTHFGPSSWNKNWIYKGDDWLYCTRWEQIIAMRDRHSMTEILTWNDFGESSYISPIHGALPANSADWVNGMDHQALNHLTKYYATAFKTGQYPSIEKDVLIMWSRPHPHDASSNDGVAKPAGWDWTADFAWAVVLSTGDATVTLTSGSNTQDFAVKAGLTKLKIPNALGGMSGKITRNGAVVANYDGAGFQYVDRPATYNYNYFVGSSS